MIRPIYVIKPFNISASITLIVITTGVDYIFGYAGGIVWNKIHRA